MKRIRFVWIGIALLTVLVVGVAIVAYASWQIQRRFAAKPADYSAHDLGTQGKAQLDAGNYQTAENYLRQALQKEDDHTYRSQLAVVEYRLKKYPESIAQYQALVAKGQDVAFADNGIGNANRDWGTAHYPQAEAAYNAAIAADPHYVAAYSNLTLLLQGQGRLSEAHKILQNGITVTSSPELSELQARLR